MKYKQLILNMMLLIVLSLFSTGCFYKQQFYKKNLELRGYQTAFFGIPLYTKFTNMWIMPFDNTYDFYLKLPDGKVLHSSNINVKSIKDLEGTVFYMNKNGYNYKYYPLPGGAFANPTKLTVCSKNDVTVDAFFCWASHHCSSSKRFYFSSANDKDTFYAMPISYGEAVKIFGEPDKTERRMSYYGQ